jgi:UDP-N-acetylmuramoyl-L-alanyl-D-glutamate--2,6-diaminopimelate ligase
MISLSVLFPGAPDSPVTGLASDSREVENGFVFVAVPGAARDGLAFLPQALDRGAAAIVSEKPRPAECPQEIIWHQESDIRCSLSLAASRLWPRQPDTILAVTGTSGKSSVADFTRQILTHIGRRAASLGTLGLITEKGPSNGALTTPGPIALHKTLHQLAQEGLTHLVMEASSHGIDQKRLDGVRLKAAAFTNLGHDHLDYHGTEEVYRAAKLRLFDTLIPQDAPVVVNRDGAQATYFEQAAQQRGLKLLTTGRTGETLCCEETVTDEFVQKLVLRHEGRRFSLNFPLIGAFQIENALVAAGLCLAIGEPTEPIFAALETLQGVPGRLERVAEIGGALCLVDYAHKPEALSHALAALRPFVSNRLICVFGCGGDRDRAKRPIMGRIAAQQADLVIITDDNPRTEDPALIRAAIQEGAPSARLIPDRRDAIFSAVSLLQEGDVLMVAGKGHETGQIVGDTVLPFSDHEVLRAAVTAFHS